MRQLPERLFLVFLLLLSLPAFNPGNGIFAGNSFEWQEDRKNSRQPSLLMPEIEEEFESKELEKEGFGSDCMGTCSSNIEFAIRFFANQSLQNRTYRTTLYTLVEIPGFNCCAFGGFENNR